MNGIEWADLKKTLNLDPHEVAAEESAIESALTAYTLRALRKQQGLSQAELALRMGISQRRVSAIERGRINRSEVNTIRAYIGALGGAIYLVADIGGQMVRLTTAERSRDSLAS